MVDQPVSYKNANRGGFLLFTISVIECEKGDPLSRGLSYVKAIEQHRPARPQAKRSLCQVCVSNLQAEGTPGGYSIRK